MGMIIFCFLLPLVGAFKFTLVGEVSLAEPIIFVCFLSTIPKLRMFWRIPAAKTILLLGVFWLISQIGADIYRNTPFADYTRGWAKIFILLVSYVGCFGILGFDFRRVIAFALGVVWQPVLAYLVYGSDLPFYKFIFGFAVSMTAFVVAAFIGRQKNVLLALFPISAGLIALILNCRSLAGITFCAAIYYIILSSGWLSHNKSLLKKIVVGLVWATSAYCLVGIYSYVAGQGKLSDEATEKYESQLSDSGSFSLLGGRAEVMFAAPKIMESPIVGWGSWARDVQYVAERSAELGNDPYRAVTESGGLIPTHSHLMGAWLEAGIFGAIFWFYVLYMIGKTLAGGWLSSTGRWSGVSSFILILLVWDIFFSPFGGERRLNNGFYLWVVTLIVVAANRIQFEQFKLRMDFLAAKQAKQRMFGNLNRSSSTRHA